MPAPRRTRGPLAATPNGRRKAQHLPAPTCTEARRRRKGPAAAGAARGACPPAPPARTPRQPAPHQARPPTCHREEVQSSPGGRLGCWHELNMDSRGQLGGRRSAEAGGLGTRREPPCRGRSGGWWAGRRAGRSGRLSGPRARRQGALRESQQRAGGGQPSLPCMRTPASELQSVTQNQGLARPTAAGPAHVGHVSRTRPGVQTSP